MSKELTIEETESLISNFQSADHPLAHYLNELSDTSKISLPPQPPLLEGYFGKVSHLRSARKGGIIIAIEAAIIIAAATGAAALTGNAPEPIVNFVKNTTKTISKAVERVASIVIGNNAGDAKNEVQQNISDTTNSNPTTSSNDPGAIEATTQASTSVQSPNTPSHQEGVTNSPAPIAKPESKPGPGIASPTAKPESENHEGASESGHENSEHAVAIPTATTAPKSTSIPAPKESSATKSETENKSPSIPAPKESSATKSETDNKTTKKPEAIKSPTANTSDNKENH